MKTSWWTVLVSVMAAFALGYIVAGWQWSGSFNEMNNAYWDLYGTCVQ